MNIWLFQTICFRLLLTLSARTVALSFCLFGTARFRREKPQAPCDPVVYNVQYIITVEIKPKLTSSRVKPELRQNKLFSNACPKFAWTEFLSRLRFSERNRKHTVIPPNTTYRNQTKIDIELGELRQNIFFYRLSSPMFARTFFSRLGFFERRNRKLTYEQYLSP